MCTSYNFEIERYTLSDHVPIDETYYAIKTL